MSETKFTEQEKLVLEKIYELFQDPNCWTKDTLARDKQGKSCDPLDPDTCSWCLLGAIYKFINNPYLQAGLIRKLSSILKLDDFTGPLCKYNDSYGREKVLELLTIALSNGSVNE